MLKGLKRVFFFKSTISSTPENIKLQVMEENRKFAIVWSTVQILYWGYCLLMSTRHPDFLVCRNIYAWALSASVVNLLLAFFVVPKVPRLIHVVALGVDAAFLGAGVAVAIHLAPKTIIIFASVLIVPVLFISDLLMPLILLTVNIILFMIVGKPAMEFSAYRWTLPNMILFSTLGLILGYYVNGTRFERFLFADAAVKLAELERRYSYYDPMTGLYNRRAYSEITDQFGSKMPAYCCVVMVDVNGLKQVNDRLGHEAGDQLIIDAAECLRQGFKGTDTIYRIGGDEFCVVITDAETDAGQCLKRTEECCKRWEGKFVSGLSLSYGYADSREFNDMDSIEKAADQRMYQFKREYYASKGMDRRRR